ncbi:MAG: DUF3849 domain-containing protein [Oscillospiraceae bacterium]|nr:DUF3849 domain-containing protein [Oscillospiraceae bacterium]
MKEIPVYKYPGAYADEHDELPAYRASTKANIACKEAIEAAIRDHYRDNRLDADATKQVIDRFGYDRVCHVLAVTIRHKDWDGRISPSSKAWAQTVPVMENPDGWGTDRNRYFVVNSHPGLTDLFLSQVRKEKEREKKPSVIGQLKAAPDAAKGTAARKLTQER